MTRLCVITITQTASSPKKKNTNNKTPEAQVQLRRFPLTANYLRKPSLAIKAV